MPGSVEPAVAGVGYLPANWLKSVNAFANTAYISVWTTMVPSKVSTTVKQIPTSLARRLTPTWIQFLIGFSRQTGHWKVLIRK